MRHVFLPLAVVAAGLVPVASFGQEGDQGILARFLQDNLSAAGRQVVVSGFAGALSSRATIRQLTIADDEGIWLTLNGVVLDWNRAAVLAGRFSVNTLSAEEIIVARPPVASAGAPAAEASGFSLPELPISVEIGEVSAPRVELGEAVLGTPVELSLQAQLTLSGGEGETRLALTRTDDGPAAAVTLAASYANASRMLVLDLDAREEAGGIAATLIGLPGTPATELTVKGEGELDAFGADLRLATDGVERLGGRIGISGDDIGGHGFTALLSGNPAPLFLPDYAAFFGSDVKLDLVGSRTSSGVLDLSRFVVSTSALDLDGTLRLAPDFLPEKIALTGTIARDDGAPVLLPTRGADRIYVDRAEVAVRHDASVDEAWNLRATVNGFRQPGIAIGQALMSGSGRIARGPAGNVVGATLRVLAADLAPDDPAMAAALGNAVTAQTRVVWQSGQPVKLSGLTVAGADYTLTGQARVDGLSTGLTVSGKLGAEIADFSRFSGLAGRPLSGSGSMQAEGSGSPLGGEFDVDATVQGSGLGIGQAEVDNLLRGDTRVVVSAARGAQGIDLRQLELTAQSLSIAASGRVASSGSKVTAKLDFADLSVLGPQYRGALDGTLDWSGAPSAGRLTLDAATAGLGIGQPEVDNLLRGGARAALSAAHDEQGVDIASLDVTATGLDVTASGRLATAGSDLTARLNLADLGVLGPRFAGRLDGTAHLTGTVETGALTLDASASGLAVGQAEADRLLQGQTTLALALRRESGAIRVDRARLVNPQVTVEATGSATGASRRVDLSARLSNLALLLPDFPGPLNVAGSAIDRGRGYELDLRGTGPGQIDARASGQLSADLGRADLAVTGSAQAGLINPFIAPRNIAGPLRFDLRVNGPLALNSLSGRVTLAGARLSAPVLGLALENLDAGIDLAGGRARVAATATAREGGGLAVAGTVGMAAPYPGDLTVTLRNMVIRDPQLYQATLAGEVRVNGPLTGGARIAGAVTVVDAEIRVPSTGMGGSAGIPDLTHKREPAAVRATRERAGLIAVAGQEPRTRASQPYPLDLTISAPNRIFVRGRGLDAELGGTLQVRGTTQQVVPSGSIGLIRGRLDILGRRLDLTEAQIQLAGNLDPTLRVVAANSSDGITSMVVIEGPISAPEVSFTSSPALPDEEVLAHLLFGRDLTSLSALQAAQLANAVAELAGRGGEGLISRLRKGFGLDDLDIVTDAAGGTALKAGRYISKNVYTEVVVGSQGTSQLNLNLDLRPGVTLRGSADSDGQTGIGIFVDKDY